MTSISPTHASQFIINLSLGIFACFILIFSFIHQSQQQVNHNLGASTQSLNTSPIHNLPPVPTHSDYALPAPGLLPTNPLYVLKMIRDRVGLITTTDPDQRATLLLHYADKRLAAARELAFFGYQDRAVEAATKAETYLFRAINQSPQVSGPKLQNWFDHLKLALLKHEEVIEQINQVVSDGQKDQLHRLHLNLDQYRLTVVSLSDQPFGYSRPEDFEAEPVPSPTPSTPPATEPYM